MKLTSVAATALILGVLLACNADDGDDGVSEKFRTTLPTSMSEADMQLEGIKGRQRLYEVVWEQQEKGGNGGS